jgi:hypothetical protein
MIEPPSRIHGAPSVKRFANTTSSPLCEAMAVTGLAPWSFAAKSGKP